MRERQRETERARENSNSKTLLLKDSSVKSIWTYLTASPCYTPNTNKNGGVGGTVPEKGDERGRNKLRGKEREGANGRQGEKQKIVKQKESERQVEDGGEKRGWGGGEGKEEKWRWGRGKGR